MNKSTKILSVILMLLFFCIELFAQVKEADKVKEPSTKLEALLLKKGRLIVKEFYELGLISGQYGTKMEISALVIYEPGQESNKTKGLKFEIESGGRYERSDSSFLDVDEIESLSNAIKYMVDLSAKWKETTKEYTEVIFSTKSDFRLGFFQKGTNQTAFSASGYVGKTSCYFTTIRALEEVNNIITKGSNLLSEK